MPTGKRQKYLGAEEKLGAVKAYKNGESVASISKILNATPQSVYNWIKRYDKEKNLNRKIGSGRKSEVSPKDELKLFKILRQPASQYGFENDLWTTKRIQIIVLKKLRKKISRMSVWRMLNKNHYSFKKVQKKYKEADQNKKDAWAQQTVKKIKRTVRKHRAILYFEDESCIQLSPEMGRSWGPKGQKIYHEVTSRKGSVSAISAISNDGRLCFQVHDSGKRFNSDDIINFLSLLLANHKRRHLVVVMDRATCHTSKKVEKFIKSQKRLHVFFLPPKSPEYNPDEQVWSHLKYHELKSHQADTTSKLKKLTRKKLKQLSEDKRKVIGIFKKCENSFLYL